MIRLVKIYLDAGHGGNDSGGTGNGLLEKDVNLDIVKRIRDMLKDYEGVQVRLSRSTDTTLSLFQRTNDANNWGADYLISVHCNTFNGQASGYEDFIYNGSLVSTTSRYRDIMHKEIIKQVDFDNRGKKRANFHMLREANMSAILTENGFLDNKEDSDKLKDSNYLNRIARGHVNGIVKIFKLSKKKQNVAGKDIYYRVVTGSFKDKKNAENRVKDLQSKGYESFIDVYRE